MTTEDLKWGWAGDNTAVIKGPGGVLSAGALLALVRDLGASPEVRSDPISDEHEIRFQLHGADTVIRVDPAGGTTIRVDKGSEDALGEILSDLSRALGARSLMLLSLRGVLFDIRHAMNV